MAPLKEVSHASFCPELYANPPSRKRSRQTSTSATADALAGMPERLRSVILLREWHTLLRRLLCATDDELLVCLLEREPGGPDGLERDLEDAGELRVLDEDDRQLGAAGDRVLHPEHDDRLVDDHELERQLRDEARVLARRDE